MKGEVIMDNQNYNNNNNPYQQNSGNPYEQNHYPYQQNTNSSQEGSSGQSGKSNSYQNSMNHDTNPYQSSNSNAYQSNNGYQNTNTYQNTNSYQSGSSTYQNANTYQSSNAYQSGSTYQNGNAYQNGSSYQSSGVQSGSTGSQKASKKKKGSGGFGIKLAKCAALALVFGLVAGSVMTGIDYAAGKFLGTEEEVAAETEGGSSKESNIATTPVSSTYVATDVSDIVEAAMPSLVSITNISETEYQSFWGGSQVYESTSCGSGIIVGKDDHYLYIATNNHVVDKAKTLTVTFTGNKTVSAEVKGTDPSTDLAVVKVNMDDIESDAMDSIKVAALGDSDALRVGQACIAIGNALGYGQTVTTGCISALNREVSVSDSSSNTSYTAELIQTDAAINPGNSGGALLNAAGEVIGINSVKYSSTEVEGIGYAIPINTASSIIEDLITKEKVDAKDSAYLGIAGVDVTSDVAGTYNMPTGVYVAQVVEHSAAEQAGIFQGDIITKFDGKTINSMESLSNTLEYYAAGTTVDVTVMRSSNGQYVEQTISVTLGKKN